MKNNKNKILKDQIIAKFEEFLKENNCYEEFVENTINETGFSLKEMLEACFDEFNVNNFVAYCFTWNYNFDFWCDIDNMWRDICKE